MTGPRPVAEPNPERSPAIREVGVLMSVYANDDPKLFERAIDSVLAQGTEQIRVNVYLCVDGVVPKALEASIWRFEPSIFRLIRNATNIGLARSLNRLIVELGSEEYVFRMDADDWSHSERFDLQISAMDADPSIGVLGGSINEIDEKGVIRKTVINPPDHDAIRKMLPARSPMAHPTVCFRRSTIERFQQYPETQSNQDLALWFKCMKSGVRFANLRDVVVDMTISDSFFARRGAA